VLAANTLLEESQRASSPMARMPLQK